MYKKYEQIQAENQNQWDNKLNTLSTSLCLVVQTVLVGNCHINVVQQLLINTARALYYITHRPTLLRSSILFNIITPLHLFCQTINQKVPHVPSSGP